MTILRIVFFLMCLGMFVTSYAQSKKSVQGVIRDARTGDALAGVSIYTNTRPPLGTFSGAEGEFTLDLPNDYHDSIVVSLVGYAAYKFRYQNVSRILAISLQQSRVLLKDVEINEKPIVAEEFVINKLDYLAVVTNPASSGDPLLAVRTLPSSSNQDESASISFRGSDPSQTGVILNGVPVYDGVKFAQLSGIGTFSIFNPQLIKSILVFPSNPPLEYGNVGSGLIDITTDSKTEKPYLQASIGLANSGVVAGIPTKHNGMFTIYSNYQNFVLIKGINSKSFSTIKSLGLTDAGIHFSRKTKGGVIAKVFSYAISENYGYQFVSPSISDNYMYNKKRLMNLVSLEKFYSKTDFSIHAGQTYSIANADIGNYITQQRNNDYYGSLNFRYYPNDIWYFRAGLSYDHRYIRTEGQFPIKTYALSDSSGSYDDTIRISRTLLEGYAYGKFKVKRFLASIGLRKNLAVYDVKDYFSFQGNLRYNIDNRQYVNLSAGRYNTYVTPSPAFYNFTHYATDQLSLDWSYQNRKSSFGASLYVKKESGIFATHTRGVEVHADRSFFKILNVDVSVSSIHSTTQYGSQLYFYQTFYVPSSYNMPFILKSLVKLNMNWINIGIYVQYRSGAPYSPVVSSQFDPAAGYYLPLYQEQPNTGTLPNYFRTDLNFSKLFGKGPVDRKWVVYLNINNVFNSLNVRTYAYSFRYDERTPQYFQKRFVYFGFVKKF